MSGPADRRRGRRQLLLVAGIFFVPLAAATWLYFSSGWRPAPGAQHGELVDPPRALPSAAMRGSWSLVLLLAGPCDPACVASLEEAGRVRLALDKDMPRVRRVLLHDGGCCEPGLAVLTEPDVLVLAAPGMDGASLRALFPPAPEGGRGIYVVDPHGNLVMSYPSAGAGRGLLKDLERLLRLSRIG
ncbi:MAG TPA: hypothetical protein VD701_05160 [Steroidobacteraceae bacterium]|nr:hypothetical protein [Steroidobacteraceae bacterium]